jgi:competence protein ComEA
MKALLLCWILTLLAASPLAAGKPAPAEPVDLNTATATELMQLPGVGAKTAARILEHRKTRGPFRRPEDLMAVKGIGEKAFLRLRPHIRAEAAP